MKKKILVFLITTILLVGFVVLFGDETTCANPGLIDGLISYYNLDEASGDAIDAHGSNNGTLYDDTTQGATGIINTSYGFDGGTDGTDYVDVGSDASIDNIFIGGGTISFWFYANSIGTDPRLMDKGANSSSHNAIVLETPTTLGFRWQTNTDNLCGVYCNNITIGTGAWYHVVITRTDAILSTPSIWINGTDCNESVLYACSGSAIYDDSSNVFVIGARADLNATRSFDGKLDEIGIWDRALDSTEIEELYNSGAGLAYPFDGAPPPPPPLAPTITSVTDYPDPLEAGSNITFSVDWNDENEEGIKMYICKADDGGISGCGAGGTWCENSNDYDLTDPITCSYTTQAGDVGFNDYYAFVCDNEPSCSSATFGTFTVQSSSPPPPTSPNVYGWAWSERIGWISFNCDNPELPEPRCATSDYGVNVNFSTGAFFGYAWAGGGENAYDGSLTATIGWIKFDPAGPYPASAEGYNWSACLDLPGTGQDCDGVGDYTVSGWARALSPLGQPLETTGGWDGWIKLKGTAQNSNPYGVTINPATNEFEGWAWAGDDSSEEAVIGWISFNCEDGGYNEAIEEHSLSITGETSDGYIYGEDTNYWIARSDSAYSYDEGTNIYVGTDYESGLGGCSGTATSCTSYHENESGCVDQAGCDWNGECTGGRPPCSDFPTVDGCNYQVGCSWFEDCPGTATSCESFDSDETNCNTQAGCGAWYESCQGTPVTCESVTDREMCFWNQYQATGQCSWLGCYGTEDSCDSFDGDEGGCGTQYGCAWEGAPNYCEGTADTCYGFDTDQANCGIQSGCTWGGCIGGSVTSCSEFESYYCGWPECSYSGDCPGTATSCSSFDSNQADCDNQAGCGSWVEGCTGTPAPCTSFSNINECVNQFDCYWGGCSGTATSCDELDEYDCDSQSGCSWEGDEEFRVYRDYLVFDTSSIPDDAVITDVKLSLKTRSDISDTDFDVQIYKFNWAEPITSSNREANYDADGAVYDADWRNTSGISTEAYYDSSSLDNSWVNKTGYTKYQLRSSGDVNEDEPYEDEYIGFYSANSAGNEPMLKVTYTIETAPAGEHYNICGDSNYKVKSILNQLPDKPTGLYENWGCCGGIPQIALRTCLILGWSYSDPDDIPPGTDPQTTYEIWVDETSGFSSPKFNHVVDPGPVSSYTVDLAADDNSPDPGGDWLSNLAWATTYWWKVKVKDSNDGWSDFSDPKSFIMPNRASPTVGFTPNPVNPRTGEEVTFIDDSKCYLSSDSDYDCDTGGVEITYKWDFDYTGIMDTDSTNRGDTTHAYPKTGNYVVQLQITDIGVGGPFTGMCSEEVAVGFPLPIWKEVTPF